MRESLVLGGGLHGRRVLSRVPGGVGAMSFGHYYKTCAIPKPESRTTRKRRIKRGSAAHVAEIRAYVFARERNLCRCCRLRSADEMHEIRPRSLRGRVGKTNSIAICRDCHHLCQVHRIAVTEHSALGAEGLLYFAPKDAAARDWLKLPRGQTGIESFPMRHYED